MGKDSIVLPSMCHHVEIKLDYEVVHIVSESRLGLEDDLLTWTCDDTFNHRPSRNVLTLIRVFCISREQAIENFKSIQGVYQPVIASPDMVPLNLRVSSAVGQDRQSKWY